MKQECDMNETYLALLGRMIGGYWYGIGHWGEEGLPAEVSFDYQLVMDRELKHHDVVGFYHTHPSFQAIPSQTDYGTMGAWTLAFGKPLICSIEGIDGLKAHWFLDNETEHVTSWEKKFGNIYIGRVPRQVRSFIMKKKREKRRKRIESILHQD